MDFRFLDFRLLVAGTRTPPFWKARFQALPGNADALALPR